MLQKPRGTIDILPDKSVMWQKVETILRETAATHGYGEIRLPTFEVSELYKRGVGDTSDVVQKEMYSFYDNDGRSLSLRPEGTAGVFRYGAKEWTLQAGKPFQTVLLQEERIGI